MGNVTGVLGSSSKADLVKRTRSSKYVGLIDQILLMTAEENDFLEIATEGVDRDGVLMTTEKNRMHIAAAIRNSSKYKKEKNPELSHTVRTMTNGNVGVLCTKKPKPKAAATTDDASKAKLAALKKKAKK